MEKDRVRHHGGSDDPCRQHDAVRATESGYKAVVRSRMPVDRQETDLDEEA
jgi:hypothetical protein